MLVWNVLCILCRWVVEAKNTILTYRKSRTSVWRKDGDLHQGSTLAYSEMPGELNDKGKVQLEKAMKAPINQDAIRKAGW